MPPQADSYRSIAGRLRLEPPKTKGSRHIATMAPIVAEPDVAELLTELRAEFPDANHHAYAWRLGRSGEQFHYSDDGEPSGAAGRPILQHLEGRDVTNAVLVVSRIFGGTKLGVGGLVRAYGGAAAAILDAVDIVVVVPKAQLRVVYPYTCSNAMQGLAHGREIEVLTSDFGADVTVEWQVLEREAEEIEQAIRDATANLAVVTRLDTR